MPTRSVITIGNFDGVHLGHRAIVSRARALADRRNARLIVMTFDPHPTAVLRPGLQPPSLSTVTRRVGHLMEAGADQVHLLKPNDEILSQSPHMFIQNIASEFAPIVIVEGQDFRFGQSRQGNIDTLRALGQQHGFEVEVVDGVEVGLSDRLRTPVSSSLVRWLVGRGRVADAALCLGRRYALQTGVIRGEQRGRTIGVPTINLDLTPLEDHIFPADGVYAGYATLPDENSDQADGMSEQAVRSSGDLPDPGSCVPHPTYPAAISVGIKPTFGERQLTVEAHLLDYVAQTPDELYGRPVILYFARWLRDQYAFPNINALRAQLQRDIVRTKQLAGRNMPGPASFHTHTPSPHL